MFNVKNVPTFLSSVLDLSFTRIHDTGLFQHSNQTTQTTYHHLKLKLKTNKKGRMEVKVVAREVRAIGALVMDQRERPKLLQETLNKKSLLVL